MGFPAAAVQLLTLKQTELSAEFDNYKQTTAQLFTLKMEHLRMESAPDVEEQAQQLTANTKGRIEQKRKEVTNKWNEVVDDQREILRLRQQLSQKQLTQFKSQVHFETQPEFMKIMNSKRINPSDKEQFRRSLREYRERMIKGYKEFRDNHYERYSHRLTQMQHGQ